jgi:hypothetical protein
VPGDGWLAGADSLNVFSEVAGRFGLYAGPYGPGFEKHRHYSLGRLELLLGARFCIDNVQRTGLGIAELVNLAILLVSFSLFHSRRIYGALQNLYFAVYVMEDVLRVGPASYHLMIRARKTG